MELQLLLESLESSVRSSIAQFSALDDGLGGPSPGAPGPGDGDGAGAGTGAEPLAETGRKQPRNKDPETRRRDRTSDEIPLPVLKNPVRRGKVIVYVHCFIQKIGEIDTVNERFYAEVQVNARWREPTLDGRKQNSVESLGDWGDRWNPDLSVVNAFSGVRETISCRLLFDAEGNATAEEQRQLHGNFSESLELWNYPFDVQELTIRLQSSRDESEVRLDKDPDVDSRVDRATFTNRQQWHLSGTVRVWTASVTDPYSSNSHRAQPNICMCCVAKRKADFFVWNIILIMICICSMIFTTFTIEPGVRLIGGRLSLSFIILLSNITFKFSVSSTIPKVPYLTYLDRYIICSMVHLCLVCIWHAITILLAADNKRRVDHVAFGVLLSCYVIFNVSWAIKSKYLSRKRKDI